MFLAVSAQAREEPVLNRDRLRRFSLQGGSPRPARRREESRLFLPFRVGLSLRLGLRGLRDLALRAAGGDLAGLRDLALGLRGLLDLGSSSFFVEAELVVWRLDSFQMLACGLRATGREAAATARVHPSTSLSGDRLTEAFGMIQ